MNITTQEAVDLIYSTRGSNPPCPFSVSFRRRTDKVEKCKHCTPEQRAVVKEQRARQIPISLPGDIDPCPECDSTGKILVEPAGTMREMVCFLGSSIQKGLAGGPAAYNPKDHELVWVYTSNLDRSFEEDPKHRRSIPADGIVKLKLRGIEYTVAG